MTALTAEVTDLLQHLIRNACVNDGTSDRAAKSAARTCWRILRRLGVDLERYEPAPGRTSLVARIEGRRPEAPTLVLMGHTDVVPANPDGWRRDPFGGELVDGEVWGRGAIDMLNLTAPMAVATRRLADEGFRPDGTLIYLAVADEEALGTYGADHLTAHEADAVQADYVITETGGIPVAAATATCGSRARGREGSCWCTLRVSRARRARLAALPHRQRAGDGGRGGPAAGRVPARTHIHETWRRFLDGMALPDEVTEPLLDPDRLVGALRTCPPAWLASSTPAPTPPSPPPWRTAAPRPTSSPTGSTCKSTSAPCPARHWPTCRPSSPTPSATWPTGSRWSRPTTTTRPRRSTRPCGTRSPG